MDIAKLAGLAKLKVDKKDEAYFERQFAETLKIISQFDTLNTSNVKETHSVTGSKNVFREDEIDTTRILTQEEALNNAKRIHNGYFVVPAVLNDNR